MANIATPGSDIRPLWRLAFRPGFLCAATFAVVGMGVWLRWMLWPQSWRSGLAPNWWHAHEMIFGFALPVVAGFLLTAVATWTGIEGTRGWRLKLLFGAWLAARILIWLPPRWQLLAALAELLFLLLVTWELGTRVWARRQWRNMPFLPVLLVLAALDLASYLHADDPARTTTLHYGAVWMVTVFIVIIGGRVTPLFTANRLGLQITPLPGWLDNLAIGGVVIIGLTIAAGVHASWFNLLCLATGALHLFRLGRWQGWKTVRVPLLWSMHLSYLCLPLALLGLAAAGRDPVAAKNIIHLLAVGAIGGMILAMMSRVSLGHTGRALEVPAYLAWAFALIVLAACIRALLPLLAADLTVFSWQLSALLWIIAFTCFIYRYLPILTRPRADGKPG